MAIVKKITRDELVKNRHAIHAYMQTNLKGNVVPQYQFVRDTDGMVEETLEMDDFQRYESNQLDTLGDKAVAIAIIKDDVDTLQALVAQAENQGEIEKKKILSYFNIALNHYSHKSITFLAQHFKNNENPELINHIIKQMNEAFEPIVEDDKDFFDRKTFIDINRYITPHVLYDLSLKKDPSIRLVPLVSTCKLEESSIPFYSIVSTYFQVNSTTENAIKQLTSLISDIPKTNQGVCLLYIFFNMIRPFKDIATEKDFPNLSQEDLNTFVFSYAYFSLNDFIYSKRFLDSQNKLGVDALRSILVWVNRHDGGQIQLALDYALERLAGPHLIDPLGYENRNNVGLEARFGDALENALKLERISHDSRLPNILELVINATNATPSPMLAEFLLAHYQNLTDRDLSGLRPKEEKTARNQIEKAKKRIEGYKSLLNEMPADIKVTHNQKLSGILNRLKENIKGKIDEIKNSALYFPTFASDLEQWKYDPEKTFHENYNSLRGSSKKIAWQSITRSVPPEFNAEFINAILKKLNAPTYYVSYARELAGEKLPSNLRDLNSKDIISKHSEEFNNFWVSLAQSTDQIDRRRFLILAMIVEGVFDPGFEPAKSELREFISPQPVRIQFPLPSNPAKSSPSAQAQPPVPVRPIPTVNVPVLQTAHAASRSRPQAALQTAQAALLQRTRMAQVQAFAVAGPDPSANQNPVQINPLELIPIAQQPELCQFMMDRASSLFGIRFKINDVLPIFYNLYARPNTAVWNLLLAQDAKYIIPSVYKGELSPVAENFLANKLQFILRTNRLSGLYYFPHGNEKSGRTTRYRYSAKLTFTHFEYLMSTGSLFHSFVIPMDRQAGLWITYEPQNWLATNVSTKPLIAEMTDFLDATITYQEIRSLELRRDKDPKFTKSLQFTKDSLYEFKNSYAEFIYQVKKAKLPAQQPLPEEGQDLGGFQWEDIDENSVKLTFNDEQQLDFPPAVYLNILFQCFIFQRLKCISDIQRKSNPLFVEPLDSYREQEPADKNFVSHEEIKQINDYDHKLKSILDYWLNEMITHDLDAFIEEHMPSLLDAKWECFYDNIISDQFVFSRQDVPLLNHVITAVNTALRAYPVAPDSNNKSQEAGPLSLAKAFDDGHLIPVRQLFPSVGTIAPAPAPVQGAAPVQGPMPVQGPIPAQGPAPVQAQGQAPLPLRPMATLENKLNSEFERFNRPELVFPATLTKKGVPVDTYLSNQVNLAHIGYTLTPVNPLSETLPPKFIGWFANNVYSVQLEKIASPDTTDQEILEALKRASSLSPYTNPILIDLKLSYNLEKVSGAFAGRSVTRLLQDFASYCRRQDLEMVNQDSFLSYLRINKWPEHPYCIHFFEQIYLEIEQVEGKVPLALFKRKLDEVVFEKHALKEPHRKATYLPATKDKFGHNELLVRGISPLTAPDPSFINKDYPTYSMTGDITGILVPPNFDSLNLILPKFLERLLSTGRDIRSLTFSYYNPATYRFVFYNLKTLIMLIPNLWEKYHTLYTPVLQEKPKLLENQAEEQLTIDMCMELLKSIVPDDKVLEVNSGFSSVSETIAVLLNSREAEEKVSAAMIREETAGSLSLKLKLICELFNVPAIYVSRGVVIEGKATLLHARVSAEGAQENINPANLLMIYKNKDSIPHLLFLNNTAHIIKMTPSPAKRLGAVGVFSAGKRQPEPVVDNDSQASKRVKPDSKEAKEQSSQPKAKAKAGTTGLFSPGKHPSDVKGKPSQASKRVKPSSEDSEEQSSSFGGSP